MKLEDKINIKSNNLNILRFVAAIMVVICHSYAVTRNQEDFFSTFNGEQCNLGALAVAIFFFISGLYVMKSLDVSKDIATFMKKRFKRIFPQLWIVVIVSMFIVGPIVSSIGVKEYFTDINTWKYAFNGILLPIHNLPGVFENNVYQTVNGPLWTLPVEFMCYIGLVILYVISERISKKEALNIHKCFHWLAFSILFITYLFVYYVLKWKFLATVVRPIVFFLEGILYYDYRKKISLNVKWASVLLLVLVLACKTPFYNLFMLLILPYVVVSFCLGVHDIKSDSDLWKISYEMYLVGWPIQQIVFELMNCVQTPYMNMFIAIPFDIIIACALYKLIEKIVD